MSGVESKNHSMVWWTYGILLYSLILASSMKGRQRRSLPPAKEGLGFNLIFRPTFGKQGAFIHVVLSLIEVKLI